MNEQDQQHSAPPDRQEARERFWQAIVFPTAKGLENFFWNLLWFALIAYTVYCVLQR
jgi:hypothetical protein